MTEVDTQVYSLKTKKPVGEPSTKVYSLKTKKPVADDDMVDEDDLLTEEDKATKTKEAGGGCATRKKACKDCSCGRAELEAAGKEVKPEDLTGGCGSCPKGDAFRCATCPFLGKPAWKPGQKVELDSLEDDI